MKIILKNADLEFQAYSEVELQVTKLGKAYVSDVGEILASQSDGYDLFYATNEEFRKIKVSDVGIFAMSNAVPSIGGYAADLGGGVYRQVKNLHTETTIDLPISAPYIIICSVEASIEIKGVY